MKTVHSQNSLPQTLKPAKFLANCRKPATPGDRATTAVETLLREVLKEVARDGGHRRQARSQWELAPFPTLRFSVIM